MFRVTIENMNDYDELEVVYRDPQNPEKVGSNKYDFTEAIRPNLVSNRRPTGRRLTQETKVLEQTVEQLDLHAVIKAINSI